MYQQKFLLYMCTRKLISEKNFSNLSTFALNVSIKTLLIAHIYIFQQEWNLFRIQTKKKKIEKKSIEPMVGTQMEFRMDPNENLNARFSIVRAWQGYTVIGVLCIQTIPVLFSFFFSFSLSLFHSLFSLEPRVKTRRLTRFVTACVVHDWENDRVKRNYLMGTRYRGNFV